MVPKEWKSPEESHAKQKKKKKGWCWSACWDFSADLRQRNQDPEILTWTSPDSSAWCMLSDWTGVCSPCTHRFPPHTHSALKAPAVWTDLLLVQTSWTISLPASSLDRISSPLSLPIFCFSTTYLSLKSNFRWEVCPQTSCDVLD